MKNEKQIKEQIELMKSADDAYDSEYNGTNTWIDGFLAALRWVTK